MTKEEEEAKRKADEEAEAERKAKEEEENSENEEEPTAEELKAELAESKKRIKALNNESAERRKKLEAFEKAEAERKQAELTEVEKAEAKAKAAEADKLKLEQENKLLKMQSSFNSKVREMKLEFVNETAAQDAFKALDVEAVGDDLAGMEDAIKILTKDRPYLFGKEDTTRQINDGKQKGRSTQEALNQAAIDKKRKGYAPL